MSWIVVVVFGGIFLAVEGYGLYVDYQLRKLGDQLDNLFDLFNAAQERGRGYVQEQRSKELERDQ